MRERGALLLRLELLLPLCHDRHHLQGGARGRRGWTLVLHLVVHVERAPVERLDAPEVRQCGVYFILEQISPHICY